MAGEVPPVTRGVLYITWPGEIDPAPLLARSALSLAEWHPELPYHVVKMPTGATLLDKAAMADLTPYEQTLFLDVDTVVMGRLDFGFEMAERHGLACCICEAPLARRYAGLRDCGDLVEYNTGVLFWTRKASPVFEAWRRRRHEVDSSIQFKLGGQVTTMPLNDQASFALAVRETGFNPFVLPMNWNFRPLWQRSFFGPVKAWHDYADPPGPLARWNAEQSSACTILEFGRLG